MTDRADDLPEEVLDDDPRRLGAALGYMFTPLVPLLNLSGDEGSDPFVRRHASQAILWSVPFLVLLILTIFLLILLVRENFLYICLLPAVILVPFLPGAYWARKVYLGADVTIPLIYSLSRRMSG